MFTNDTHTLKKVVLFFQLLISKINCFLQVSNKYCRTCLYTPDNFFKWVRGRAYYNCEYANISKTILISITVGGISY